MTTEIWRAGFDTSHFSFEAFGHSRNQALYALKKGWEAHVRATGADPGYLDKYAEDIWYDTIQIGCLRDKVLIWEGD
jgi:hypothetical protein